MLANVSIYYIHILVITDIYYNIIFKTNYDHRSIFKALLCRFFQGDSGLYSYIV